MKSSACAKFCVVRAQRKDCTILPFAKLQGVSSRHFVQLIEEAGRTGFWASNFETGHSTASIGYYRILGRDPSCPISYQEFVSTIHPEDRPHNMYMDEVIRSGQPINRKFRIIRPDGSVRWIVNRADVILGNGAKPVRAVGMIRDITDWYDLRSSLFQSERRLSAVLRAMNAALWVVDTEGRIEFGHRWQELTGQSTTETAESGWLNAIHVADRERVRERFSDWGAAFSARCRIRLRDGNFGRFEFRSISIATSNDSPATSIVLLAETDLGDEADASRKNDATREEKMTDAQLRAARGILAWSVKDLARACGVSASTIRRIENGETQNVHQKRLIRIRHTLEEAGIDFLYPHDSKPGVRPR